MKTAPLLIALASLGLSTAAFAQTMTYLGNGAGGFGGPVGGGSLQLSSAAGTLTGTYTRGGGQFNDILVLYIDSQAGGLTNTSTLGDNADGGRSATSGFDGTNRSTVTFASGFAADYAITIGNSFAVTYQLASGGPNSLVFGSNGNLSPMGNTQTSYTFTLPLSSLGLTAGQGFRFVATYLNTQAFRSNESFLNQNNADPFSGAAANIGSAPVTLSNFSTFGTPVPEPSTIVLSLISLAGFTALRRRNRR